MYQCADIEQLLVCSVRVDEIFRKPGQLEEDREPNFTHLPVIVATIVTIPHSSVLCESIVHFEEKPNRV